ncbi:MAG: 23S rRNA (guanosine(2251)-2'-O)-methyltransferase RlmB [Acidimicrobiales bacterium]
MSPGRARQPGGPSDHSGRGGGRPGGRPGSGHSGAGRPGSGRGSGGRPGTGRARGVTGREPSSRGVAPPRRRDTERAGLGGDQVEGRQAVRELLAAGVRPVRVVYLAEGMEPSPVLDDIEALARRRKVRLEVVPRRRLDALARTDGPQGVVAQAVPVGEVPLDDLCGPTRRGRVPFLVVLDGVTDPTNLGAVLRSAECAGVTGVVLPRHRAVHLTPTVAKVAAGAIEHLPMAVVPGVPAALRRLAALGVWTVGLDQGASRSIYELAVGDQSVALVLGSEGSGLAPLTRARCDELVAIPQHGALASLNVATAGAIACFELARVRAAGGRSPA